MPMPNPFELALSIALEALHAAVDRCRVAVSLEYAARSACGIPASKNEHAPKPQQPALKTGSTSGIMQSPRT